MGFDLNVNISAITVFLQGLLSFFSPCVLPLIPLYIGYLSGGALRKNESGETVYNQKKVMLHTLFFVIGVSFAFLVLGLGVSAAGSFFSGNQMLFARLGGVIVILFGVHQLGIFGESSILSREKKLSLNVEQAAMSPVTALIMGFTFSFAWTPCVGPALASVLLMTASAGSRVEGFILIGLYTAGFVIPFLLVGIFTTRVLNLFRKYRGVVKYTVKIGGCLMILMGIMMITGTMNSITGYLSRISIKDSETAVTQEAESETELEEESEKEEEAETEVESEEEQDSEKETTQDADEIDESNESLNEKDELQESINEKDDSQDNTQKDSQEEATEDSKLAALDFTLTDQFGIEHSLEEYKGKVIFLNFWATWCPPCRNEMPEIQKLYEEFSADENSEVEIVGVAGPEYGQEGSVEDISNFLSENGYTYPVLMDETAELFQRYGIYAYPTTIMIDRDGNVYGYVTGQLTEEIMRDIISQTLNGNR